MTTSPEMLKNGFFASPNNIHSLPGQEWYAGSRGIPTVKFGQEIRLIDGNLSIWTTKYYQRPDNTFMFSISGIVAELDSFDSLIDYCKANGRISEPGLPAYLWGD